MELRFSSEFKDSLLLANNVLAIFTRNSQKQGKKAELPIQIELISTTHGVLAVKSPRMVNHKSTIACHIETTCVVVSISTIFIRIVHTTQ